jgi:hypothetical protein
MTSCYPEEPSYLIIFTDGKVDLEGTCFRKKNFAASPFDDLSLSFLMNNELSLCFHQLWSLFSSPLHKNTNYKLLLDPSLNINI